MNLLLWSIQTNGFNKSLQKTRSYLLWLIAFALVFAMSSFLSTTTLSAHESPIYYDTCDDITDAGTIAGDQSGCGDPFYDPDIIISTSPATGGSSALEYLWMFTTDDPNGNSTIWNIIPGTNSESYDPGPISQTTYYRRCARRAGCVLWINESNFVTAEFDCSLPSIGDTVFFDENGNGIQDNNEAGVAGIMVKLLDAGPDGVFGTGDENIVSTVTTDSNGQFLFVDVGSGTYIIEFMSNSLPDGFTFTSQNIGDDANDSDADGNGQTDPFTVDFGNDDDLTFDAGLILTCTLEIQAITGVNPMCNPGNTGIVALSVAGGTAPYTYIWSNGATTQDINGLPAGTYCVTITDFNGCTLSDCVTLSAPNPIMASTNFNPEVCGQSNGNIDLSANGGTGPYTYQWNNGATTQDLNNLPAGTYCVVITDTNGCNISECYVIGAAGNNTVSISPNSNTICQGETLSLSASGSASNTYSWSTTGGFFNTTSGQNVEYTMNTPGTFTITVNSTSTAGCTATATTTVVVNPPLFIGGNATDASCNANNGAINATVSGGTAPFTYAWNTGQTTPDLSSLAAGNYCLTVTDANGCTNNNCFNVGSGSTAAPATISGPTAICPGESITLSANSADAVSYSWTTTGGTLGSPNGQNTSYTMMVPGTYTITVNTTNAQGCASSANTTVTVYQPVNVTGTVNDAACGVDNGLINLSLTSGSAPFTFEWSTGATTQGISNLAAGQYCVTVTDSNGCENSECYTIQSSSNLTVSLDVTEIICNELGTLTAQVSGGLAPFTYQWNTGQTTGTIMNLVAGEYCVMVTDANGCQNMQCFTLAPVETTVVSGTVVNPICDSNNGSISTTIDPNISVTYAWSTGQTTSNLNNLAAGNYTVTVTSVDGCTSVETFTLVSDEELLLSLTPMDPSCAGLDNGMINSMVNFTGSGSLIYTWSNGATTPNITDLPGGDYCLTVTSTDGCEGIECVSLMAPQAITPDAVISGATCDNEDGSINLTVSGGTVPYTYAWSNAAITQDIENLAPGQYCVTITDANGCQNMQCFTLVPIETTVVSGTVVNPICNSNNGSISTTIDPNISVTYAWSTGQTTPNLNNLAAGNYTVTVTSVDGCTSVETFTLVSDGELLLSLTPTDPLCAGLDNGMVNSMVNFTGSGSLIYTWSNGATTPNITDLPAGDFCVTVTSTDGCEGIECVSLMAPQAITPDAVISGATCDNENGSINLTVSGGTLPYTYAWSNGAITQDIEDLAPGQYCVTITDANGCQNMQCFTLAPVETTAVSGTVVNPTCNSNNGSISTTIDPNISVTYAWSTGQTTPNLNNLVAGTYTVTVTSVDGCTSVETFTLESNGELLLSLTPTDPLCAGLDNGMVNSMVNFTGSGSLIYTWSNGATTPNITDLPAGDFCVTVTSTDGCEGIDCVTLTAPQAVTSNAFISGATCNNEDGKIKLTVSGGTEPYKFNWSNGAITQNIEDLAPGEYCVAICDANGCTFEDCFTVVGGANFNTSIQANNISCHGASDGSATANTDGGSNPFTYMWSTGATTSTISNLPAGNYCVMVTDRFGCSDQECVTITEPAPINISTSSISTTCSLNNGSATVSFGFTASSVTWTGPGINANTNTINNLAPGTYTVQVVSQAGCIATDMVTINPSDILEVTIAPINTAICPGETVSFTSNTNSVGTSYAWSATSGSFSSTTSANPTYSNMVPGTYTIALQATTASGCTDTEIVVVTVRDNDDPICNPNMDLVNIGNFVWFDSNNNGIQDPGEIEIEGVEVKLMTAGPDGIFYTDDDVTIASEFTDSMGLYLFENVVAGDYIIMFCIDTFPGTEFTTQNTGGDDELDSDANRVNGKTDPFNVVAGQDDNLSFDAGIILTPTGCDNITKAGDICCDQVLCGAGSVPDLITNTTLPSGGSGAIEYIWMSTTLAGPFNIATWDTIPGATGSEYQPGPIFETTFIARCARRVGCDNYFETSIITLEVVDAPTVSITSLPAFICIGESDNFHSTDAGIGGTYSWDLGQDASPATATGQFLTNVSWSTAGAKTITLTTTNNAGCIFELTRTVTVGNCLTAPVSDRFIDFSISPMEESMDVDLKWNTNEDMNDFYFVVEHSAEGEDFEIIHTMDGKEAYENKEYDYLDESARPGRNYYRIKHINNNGQTERSETLMVILAENADKFILFPNPTVDYVFFESLRLTDEEGVIIISDMKGMIIDQIVIPPNTERMRVNMGDLSPGSYVLYTQYIDIRSVPQIIFKSEK